jgi:hypothetical protein
MVIYAKSSVNGEEKERLAEHTIKDINAGRILVENSAISHLSVPLSHA